MAKKKAEKSDREFTCIVGCNVPTKDGERRYESGDQIKETDVSPESIKALIEMDAIVENGTS